MLVVRCRMVSYFGVLFSTHLVSHSCVMINFSLIRTHSQATNRTRGHQVHIFSKKRNTVIVYHNTSTILLSSLEFSMYMTFHKVITSKGKLVCTVDDYGFTIEKLSRDKAIWCCNHKRHGHGKARSHTINDRLIPDLHFLKGTVRSLRQRSVKTLSIPSYLTATLSNKLFSQYDSRSYASIFSEYLT